MGSYLGVLRVRLDVVDQRPEVFVVEAVDLVVEVDRCHHENFRALVDYIQANPEHAEVAAHLITASKAIERISDHSTNIAKGVVFLIEGIDIRHASVQDEMTPGDRPFALRPSPRN